jgi:hypothetical protein
MLSFIRQAQRQQIGKPNSFWEHEAKGPNRKAKTGQHRICLREANRSFNNNYIIKELEISIINICNKPYQCRNTDYWAR